MNQKNSIELMINETAKIPGLSEVIINGLENVYAEKDGSMVRLDAKFSEDEVNDFCKKIADYNNKEFSQKVPILDGSLPDGSRVNLIHKDYTNSCHAITIRKFSKTIKTFDTSPGVFGLGPKWVEFFRSIVRGRLNIIISGGTGVGKTTFLNLLLQEVSQKERVISIEDTRELSIKLPNLVSLEARPTVGEVKGLVIRELVKNTLRMRPDRIIVGEVRGGEVFDLLQAMNTGHEGSMTSVHANSPSECLLRLENLYMLAGFEIPLKALRYQISAAIDFIIQIKRDRNGSRFVHQVTEVANLEGDRILLQDVGVFKDGKLAFNGLAPSSFAKLQNAGLPKDFFADF